MFVANSGRPGVLAAVLAAAMAVLFGVGPGLLITGSVVGQAPPGQQLPNRTATVTAATAQRVASRVKLGEAALRDGQYAAARDHFQSALFYVPADPVLLAGLLQASAGAGDEDARLLWAIRLYRSRANDRGRMRLDRAMRAVWPAGVGTPVDNTAARLSSARAAAVAELAGFASRRRRGRAATGAGVMVRWVCDLAWELMKDAPALQTRYGPDFQQALSAQIADYQTVLEALRMVSQGRVKPRPKEQGEAVSEQAIDDVAVRAARCLTGMVAQAKFKDRHGPKPPALGGLVGAAGQARQKVRDKIDKRVGVPWTMAQLTAMSEAEREAFTRAHATWANPGIGVSPTGKYLIHTICGHGTLLGAVETIEMHHARLVAWYGKDPFAGRQGTGRQGTVRQGTVRIVPAADGLESEGAPYWWAGGFQSGDLTTVKFNWRSIGSLGRLLTHELTHRFDFRIYAFLPSWATEGRAVWTAGAYGRAEQKQFFPNRLNKGTCSSVFVKGYGSARKLRQLVEGKIDDYRDNYSAGYALFAYLRAWEKAGKRLYAERLQTYFERARAGRSKPLEWFVHCFADGEDGRPADFKEFAAEFRGFLRECYQWGWNPRQRPPWADRYKYGQPPSRRQATVDDEPTWIWDRQRAEPWFGQRHAALAGQLLAELGQDRPAVAALTWSLGVDDWQRAPALLLAGLLERLGHRDVAWVVRAELDRRRLAAPSKPLGVAPSLGRLPKTRAFFGALRDAASAANARSLRLAAHHLLTLHNTLARLVGIAAMPSPKVGSVRPLSKNSFAPRLAPSRHLGAFGFTESGLTGYEERRQRGLWYEATNGDLHVGRNKPRQDSGLLDRRAHQRHAFVHTAEWFGPQPYIFKTTVHFTTSFVAGAVVLGFTRRDRNIRLKFRAGDFLFAIGRKPTAAKTRRIKFSMNGGWPRERHFPRSSPSRPFRFDNPTSHFDLAVRVDGARAEVRIEGKLLFTYTTPDLSPIRGAIGVAVSQGALRLQDPQVVPWQPVAVGGAEVTRYEQLYGRRLPPIPTDPSGTIAVWLPIDAGDDDGADGFDYPRWTRRAIRRLGAMLDDALHYPQKWVVMMPSSLSAEAQSAVRKLAQVRGLAVVIHAIDQPFRDSIYGLYVDAWGAVRFSTDLLRDGTEVPDELRRWARRSRPRR